MLEVGFGSCGGFRDGAPEALEVAEGRRLVAVTRSWWSLLTLESCSENSDLRDIKLVMDYWALGTTFFFTTSVSLSRIDGNKL